MAAAELAKRQIDSCLDGLFPNERRLHYQKDENCLIDQSSVQRHPKAVHRRQDLLFPAKHELAPRARETEQLVSNM